MKTFCLVTCLLAVFNCVGQSFQSTNYGVELRNLDYLDQICPPTEFNSSMGFKGMPEITKASAERVVNQMLTEMGITNRYKLRECKVLSENNARAQAFTKDGRILKYIVYDIDFLRKISNSTETNYAAMFVLAHEVGHHINDHSINYSGSEIDIELQADLFAGTRLSIIGANLDETLTAVRTTPNIKTNKYSTHPGRIDRMKAVYEGWMNYARNDDEFLAENANHIKAYEKEIAGYEGRSLENKKTLPKTLIEKRPTTKTKTTTDINRKSDNIRVPKLLPKRGLNRSTVDQKVAVTVLPNYFKALGGVKKLNTIKDLAYTERTIRSDRPSWEYQLDYTKENHNLLLINERQLDRVKRQFKISNDSLYYRHNNFGSWTLGIPEDETIAQLAFASFVGSQTAAFMEDFELLSSPERYKINHEVQFNGKQCYKMELKERLVERQYRPGAMGKTVTEQENRYYSIEENLLVGIEKVLKTFYVRGGAPKGMDRKSSTIKIMGYQTVDGLRFPEYYEIEISTKLRKDSERSLTITKKVRNINFKQ